MVVAYILFSLHLAVQIILICFVCVLSLSLFLFRISTFVLSSMCVCLFKSHYFLSFDFRLSRLCVCALWWLRKKSSSLLNTLNVCSIKFAYTCCWFLFFFPPLSNFCPIYNLLFVAKFLFFLFFLHALY